MWEGIARLAVTAAAALGVTAADARAYVYWGDNTGTTLSRADLDGTAIEESFVAGAYQPLGVAVSGGYVYWANRGTNSIGRADLDGSDPNPTFITGADVPGGVAVTGGHIYWSNFDTATIGRANLDGSGVDQSFVTGASGAVQVAVGSYIFWANTGGSVGRANLDGSGVNPSFIPGIPSVYGVAVDAGYVYWTDSDNDTIGRANLDGTGENQSFITGAADPLELTEAGGELYWTNHASGTIGRSSLDGSGVNQTFITGAPNAYGVAVDGGGPTLTPSPQLSFGAPSTNWTNAYLPVACSGPTGTACRELVGLQAGGHTVGSTAATVAAGTRTTLRIALNRTGEALLARRYRLTATLTAGGSGRLTALVGFSLRAAAVLVHHPGPRPAGAGGVRFGVLYLSVPAHTRVTVRCHGRGCPFTSHRFSGRTRVDLAPLLHGRALLRSAAIEATIAAPSSVEEVFSVRGGYPPRYSGGCLPPGATRVAACR